MEPTKWEELMKRGVSLQEMCADDCNKYLKVIEDAFEIEKNKFDPHNSGSKNTENHPSDKALSINLHNSSVLSKPNETEMLLNKILFKKEEISTVFPIMNNEDKSGDISVSLECFNEKQSVLSVKEVNKMNQVLSVKVLKPNQTDGLHYNVSCRKPNDEIAPLAMQPPQHLSVTVQNSFKNCVTVPLHSLRCFSVISDEATTRTVVPKCKNLAEALNVSVVLYRNPILEKFLTSTMGTTGKEKSFNNFEAEANNSVNEVKVDNVNIKMEIEDENDMDIKMEPVTDFPFDVSLFHNEQSSNNILSNPFGRVIQDDPEETQDDQHSSQHSHSIEELMFEGFTRASGQKLKKLKAVSSKIKGKTNSLGIVSRKLFEPVKCNSQKVLDHSNSFNDKRLCGSDSERLALTSEENRSFDHSSFNKPPEKRLRSKRTPLKEINLENAKNESLHVRTKASNFRKVQNNDRGNVTSEDLSFCLGKCSNKGDYQKVKDARLETMKYQKVKDARLETMKYQKVKDARLETMKTTKSKERYDRNLHIFTSRSLRTRSASRSKTAKGKNPSSKENQGFLKLDNAAYYTVMKNNYRSKNRAKGLLSGERDLFAKAEMKQEIHKCYCCDFTSMDKNTIDDHLNTHKIRSLLYCTHCPYFSKSKSKFVLHSRVHTGERPYTCDKCPYSARNVTTLNIHRRAHTGEKPYKCNFCDFSGATYSIITTHIRKHAKETILKRDLISVDSNGNSHKKQLKIKKFDCPYCPSKFSFRSGLTRHLEVHLDSNGDNHRKRRKIKKFDCPYCPSKFPFRSGLTRHLEVHLNIKKVKCPLCSYRCRQCSAMKLHISRRHKNANKELLRCKFCDFKATDAAYMMYHLRSHDQCNDFQKWPIQKFICSICFKSYTKSELLNEHMLLAHNRTFDGNLHVNQDRETQNSHCSPSFDEKLHKNCKIPVEDYDKNIANQNECLNEQNLCVSGSVRTQLESLQNVDEKPQFAINTIEEIHSVQPVYKKPYYVQPVNEKLQFAQPQHEESHLVKTGNKEFMSRKYIAANKIGTENENCFNYFNKTPLLIRESGHLAKSDGRTMSKLRIKLKIVNGQIVNGTVVNKENLTRIDREASFNLCCGQTSANVDHMKLEQEKLLNERVSHPTEVKQGQEMNVGSNERTDSNHPNGDYQTPQTSETEVQEQNSNTAAYQNKFPPAGNDEYEFMKEEFNYECSYCEFGTNKLFRLNIHLTKHSDMNPFECSFCPQTFSRPVELKKHMKKHTDEDES